MADPRLREPATPVLTAAPRSRFTGRVHQDFPEVELVVPIAPGQPTEDGVGTASYRYQYRVWLNPDVTTPEEWVNAPEVEATASELVVAGVVGVVELDVRVWAVSAAGVISAPLMAVSRQALIGQASRPTGLALAAVHRTDALNSRAGFRATWTVDEGVYSVVRYRHEVEPWVELPATAQSFLEVVPAAAGRWQVEVRAQTPVGVLSARASSEITLTVGSSDHTLPTPSGLELVGPEGSLQGSSREWVGRDLRVRWTPLRVDALEPDTVSTAPEDALLEFVVVKVRDPSTGVLLREEQLPIIENEYVYPLAANAEDGTRRALTVEVAYKDRTGRLSAFAPLTGTNPAPNAPGLIVHSPTFGRVTTVVALPSNPDPDIAGLLVWMDTTPGFTPGDDNLVADVAIPSPGATTQVTADYAAPAGDTVYVVVAFYDAFTRDPDLLNLSAEDDVAVPKVGTLDVESGAIQTYSKFVKSSAFAALDSDGETETYGPVSFDTVDANTIVIPRYVFDVDFSSGYSAANDTCRLTTELLRRPAGGSDTVIATSVIDFHFNAPSTKTGPTDTMRVTLPTFSAADVVGSAGTFEYRLRLTVNVSGSSTLYVQAANLQLEAFVVRR